MATKRNVGNTLILVDDESCPVFLACTIALDCDDCKLKQSIRKEKIFRLTNLHRSSRS